jgi:hypothetical protein
MRFLERYSDQPGGHADGGSDSVAPGGLQQVRSRSNQLLAAGDAAIQRIVTRGDAEALNRAARQQGGQ